MNCLEHKFGVSVGRRAHFGKSGFASKQRDTRRGGGGRCGLSLDYSSIYILCEWYWVAFCGGVVFVV